MQPLKDLAIVLRSIPFEERHRVVTALTENHGVISAMAKNSIQSRRFGGTLQPFTASEWMFSHKPGTDLYLLSEAHLRRSFDGLRKSFDQLSLASTFTEVILRLAPQGEACPELFRLYSNALATLDDEIIDLSSGIPLLNAFLAKLLQWSGSQPRLLSCLQCELPLEHFHASDELSCVIADAGWICPKCRMTSTKHLQERRSSTLQRALLRLPVRTIQDFQTSLRTPIRQITKQMKASTAEHKGLFQFLVALYTYHVPGFDQKPLKSLRFLGLESTGLPEEVSPQQNWPVPSVIDQP